MKDLETKIHDFRLYYSPNLCLYKLVSIGEDETQIAECHLEKSNINEKAELMCEFMFVSLNSAALKAIAEFLEFAEEQLLAE